MTQLGASGDDLTVGGEKRVLHLAQKTTDPDVAPIALKQAQADLGKALRDLPKLKPPAAPAAERQGVEPPPVWFLALDEIAPTGMDVRPHLPMEGRPTMAEAKGPTPLETTPVELKSLELDPLTVADDPDFLTQLATEKNLPEFVKEGLPLLYP
jgi:5-methylthioadenosine/S-adenosylhomocysteine deaminase